MPTFAYVAKDQTGQIRKGTSDAENESILRRRLQEQGFTVAQIKQTKEKNPAAGFGRISLAELAVFCRQFSTMIDAGVPMVRCLTVLQEQTRNPKLKRIVADISAEVQGGQTLSRAMAKYPNVFNSMFTGLIRAGEIGGVLEESMQRLATFLEDEQALRRKVKGAMTYPIIIMVVALVIVSVLVTVILPKFMTLFKDLGVKEFPLPTQIMMNVSNFAMSKWYIVVVFIIGFVIAFRTFIKTQVGRRIWDRIKLKAPVLGILNHKVALAKFSRTLGTLLASGVSILQALETCAGAVDNEIISDAILEARARIREGDLIAAPLQRSKMFPPMVVQMITIGQESGSLEQMLQKIAEFYEAEVDAALESLTAAIEPVMIVFMGFTVGFIVISMLLPIVQVVNTLTSSGGG